MKNGGEKTENEAPGDRELKRRLRLLSEIACRTTASIEELGKTLGISEEVIRSDIRAIRSMSIPLHLESTRVTFSRLKGKRPGADMWKRRIQIVADTIRDRLVPVRKIEQSFQITRDAVVNDISVLRSLGIPIELSGDKVVFPPIGIEALWRDTAVGSRLQDADSIKAKEGLSQDVVNYLCIHKDRISSVLVGTGVTAYRTSLDIFAREIEHRIETVHSASLLVLFAFICCRPTRVNLQLAGGQLDRTTAWLEGESGVEQLRVCPADAVITSFMHLSTQGFRTTQPYEVGEKLMNLRHATAQFVLVPMEWSKLAGENGMLVAPPGGTGEDVFDFLDGRRKYVIFTDPPASPRDEKDNERFEVLDYWENKYQGTEYKDCLQIVRVPQAGTTGTGVQE